MPVIEVSEVELSDGEPIGVDIEAIDEIAPVAVGRMVNDDERAWINAAPNLQERNLRMSQTWTRIEAILKAEGVGFSIDPRKDGMPGVGNTSAVTYGRCVISCAARSKPRIVVKEHAFRVA